MVLAQDQTAVSERNVTSTVYRYQREDGGREAESGFMVGVETGNTQMGFCLLFVLSFSTSSSIRWAPLVADFCAAVSTEKYSPVLYSDDSCAPYGLQELKSEVSGR